MVSITRIVKFSSLFLHIFYFIGNISLNSYELKLRLQTSNEMMRLQIFESSLH
jgi:hypothetical protein